MNRPMTESKPDPWRAPVTVAHIPDTGLHRELEASPAERQAVAEFAGLREILPLHASFDVVPKSGGRIHVTGHVRARVGQTCVVTLDPIESEIDEEIDLIFAPEAEVRRLADLIEEGRDDQEPPKSPIRRSQSSTGSSTSAGLRPTRCSWRLIPIRASPVPCSRRRSPLPIPRTIPLQH